VVDLWNKELRKTIARYNKFGMKNQKERLLNLTANQLLLQKLSTNQNLSLSSKLKRLFKWKR
jgi:hypothetical protein